MERKFNIPGEVRDVVDSARQRVQRGMNLGRAGTTTALASIPLGAIDLRLTIAGAILGTGIGLVGAAEADLPYLDQMEFRNSTAQEPIQSSAGFDDEETTIMSVGELQRASEEGRLAHEALALIDGTKEPPPTS